MESTRDTQARVDGILEFLGLNFWVFRVSSEISEGEDWAKTHFEEQYNEATIVLGRKYHLASFKEQTQVLLHEILHGPVHRIHQPILDAIKILMIHVPKSQQKIVQDHLTIAKKTALREEETMVNTLATGITKAVPGLARKYLSE